MFKGSHRIKLLAGLLGLLAVAQAHAVSTDGMGANVLPGQVAKPTAIIDFGGPFSAITFYMNLDYDPTWLSFLPEQSRIRFNDNDVAFNDFIAMLLSIKGEYGDLSKREKFIVPSTGREAYRYSFYGIDENGFEIPVQFAKPVLFELAFLVDGDAPPGPLPPLNLEFNMADMSGDELFLGEPEFRANFNSITVVPEPQEWALWLAGLSLVAWRGLAGKRSADSATA